jgi:hypothetical protein
MGGVMTEDMINQSDKSPEDKARALAYLPGARQPTPQPLPYAPVTALEQTSRRRNAVPTGRQLGTILTGPTRAGDKKALLGQ